VPFATYNLTPEEQEAYLDLIHEFWPWNYYGMEAWEINDNMADILTTMVETIADCSQGFAIVNIMVDLINSKYQGKFPNTKKAWRDFIKNHSDMIAQALGILRYNRNYRPCVDTAAWHWKSPFDIAYWDY